MPVPVSPVVVEIRAVGSWDPRRQWLAARTREIEIRDRMYAQISEYGRCHLVERREATQALVDYTHSWTHFSLSPVFTLGVRRSVTIPIIWHRNVLWSSVNFNHSPSRLPTSVWSVLRLFWCLARARAKNGHVLWQTPAHCNIECRFQGHPENLLTLTDLASSGYSV